MHLLLLRFANKKFLLPILGVFIFASLFFPQPADAIGWLDIVCGPFCLISDFFFGGNPITGNTSDPGVLEKVLQSAFTFVFTLTAGFLQVIYEALAGLMMKAVMYFVSIPVDPSQVSFVKIGWDFTRGLANGFFLLILAFIGLATILRLQSYQLQRTLPLLIIAALLINFSGVFVSVIVDIGNLFTNFFLQGSLTGPFHIDPFGNLLPSQDSGLENVAINVARILYFLFGSLLFFAILLIFGLRVIVLWVIVILAPIAFASIILPFTKKWWQRWLSALMEWAFIGVPIAFFMYLASSILFMPIPPSSNVGAAFLAALAPIAALVLLFLGTMFSVGLAGSLGGRFQTALQRAPNKLWRSKAGSKIKGNIAGRTGRVIGVLPGGLQSLSTNLKERGEKAKNPFARWAMQKAGGNTLGALGTATGKVTGFAERPLMEAEEKNRKLALPAGFEKWGPQRQAKWISSLMFASDRVQAGKILADNGTLRFTSPEFIKQYDKDIDWAREKRDDFYQDPIIANRRTKPEDLKEREDLQWTLQRNKVSKGLSEKILKKFDEKTVRERDLAQKEERGETLTDVEKEEKKKAEGFSEDELKGLGVKENQSKRLSQTIKEARKKNKEAREDIATALRKDEDGSDIHVGLDIEYGVQHKIITRELAENDRAAAVKEVRNSLAKTGKMPDYEKKGRDMFLRDSAATKVAVRDERSQYIKNIADITGDNLGLRSGLAEGPSQHLREMQQTFGREAVLDVFDGAGGINDHIESDVDHYALKSAQMFAFLQSPLGREYPSEARNYMRDMRGKFTDNQADHRKRIRVVQLAEEDKVEGEKQSLVGLYYAALQRREAAQSNIKEARAKGLPAAEIEKSQKELGGLEREIEKVQKYYRLGERLDEPLRQKYGIKTMPNGEERQRIRLKEVERLWGTPTGRDRDGEGELDDEGDDLYDLENPGGGLGGRGRGRRRDRDRGGRSPGPEGGQPGGGQPSGGATPTSTPPPAPGGGEPSPGGGTPTPSPSSNPPRTPQNIPERISRLRTEIASFEENLRNETNPKAIQNWQQAIQDSEQELERARTEYGEQVRASIEKERTRRGPLTEGRGLEVPPPTRRNAPRRRR